MALSLVPMVGMTVLAAQEATRRADVAAQAHDVQVATAELGDLVGLRFALIDEHLPGEGVGRVHQVGLTPAQASALIGFDLVERLAATRAATDAAMARLPAGVLAAQPALARLPLRLAEVREAVDAGGDPGGVAEAYLALVADVDVAVQRWQTELLAAERAVGVAALGDALRSFAAATAVAQAGQVETTAFGRYLFESADPTVKAEIVLAVGRHARELEVLEHEAGAAAAAAWERLRDHPTVVGTAATTADVVRSGGELGWTDLSELAQVFVDLFARADLYAGMVEEVGAVVVAAADDARAQAQAALARGLAATLGVGGLAVALALAVSWSITRPLRRLEQAAGRVSDGRLDGLEVGGRGPREVAVVAGALAETAANLRLVAVQSQALAQGQLDHEALGQPVPGLLGEAVQASVAQLAESLRAQEALRAELAHQAAHDVLTGLPNRAGALSAAERALARARRQGQQIALLFIDLDGFKRANDNHGHSTGDQVLRIVGERLSGVVRGGDVVARLGGDEFLVVAEPVAAVEEAVELGRRLIEVVRQPLDVDGKVIRVGASVGVAVNLDGHVTATDLLGQADGAVYRAKERGRGCVEVFDEGLRRELQERAQIEQALRAGIERGELALHYQPVVDADTGRLQGLEALVRWERPGHGLVPPDRFVPVAESSDLVLDLGRWVLDEATAQLAAWSARPALAHAHVAVNISGRHLLNAVIVEDVRRALERSGLDPCRLVVEVTETVLLSDVTVAAEHLARLRALGVRVALDDFGTGYTSIGQLHRLPVDLLKIDRSFVAGLEDHQDRSIVRLVVDLAHTLGLGLVAEGVEDDRQLEALRELACDEVQGYLIARPMVDDEVVPWAERARR